jgi:hypothetical protein
MNGTLNLRKQLHYTKLTIIFNLKVIILKMTKRYQKPITLVQKL